MDDVENESLFFDTSGEDADDDTPFTNPFYQRQIDPLSHDNKVAEEEERSTKVSYEWTYDYKSPLLDITYKKENISAHYSVLSGASRHSKSTQPKVGKEVLALPDQGPSDQTAFNLGDIPISPDDRTGPTISAIRTQKPSKGVFIKWAGRIAPVALSAATGIGIRLAFGAAAASLTTPLAPPSLWVQSRVRLQELSSPPSIKKNVKNASGGPRKS